MGSSSMGSQRKGLLQRESKRRNVFSFRKRMLLTICLFIIVLFVWFFEWNNNGRNTVTMKPIIIRTTTEEIRSASMQENHEIRNEEKEKKLVVLWTPFFSQRDYVLPLDRYSCPETNCDFVSNRSLIREADAVMFHARDTSLQDLPKHRSSKQRWILLHHEAPPNTPKDLMQGLDNLINWTATYRSDSDIVLTPMYRKRECNKTLSRSDRHTNDKTRLVAWFVSNCKTDSKREDFAQELRKTVTIDIFGSCGQFTCHPKMSQKCYETIEREYFFYLSLENAICKDYVTEKLFNILDYHTIPIVFGGNQADFLPAESFINVFDFKSTADLGQHLIQLSKNVQAYEKYFDWKKEYEMAPYQHYACQICSKLNDNHEPVKVWKNLSQWWFEESKCKSWSSPDDESVS